MKFGLKELVFIVGSGVSQTACVGDNSSQTNIQDFEVAKTCDASITLERESMNTSDRILDILKSCDEKILRIAESGYCGIPVENILSGKLEKLDIDKACFYLDPVISQNIYSGQVIDEPIQFQNIFGQLRKLRKNAPEISRQVENSQWIKIIIDEYKTTADRPLYLYSEILQSLNLLSQENQIQLSKNPNWRKFLHRFDEILVAGDIEGNLVSYLVDTETSEAQNMRDELLLFIAESKQKKQILTERFAGGYDM